MDLFDLNNKLYKIVPIIGTTMESKEDVVLEVFFNNPTREWRFKDLLLETKLARSKLDSWLKKFQKDKLVSRIKKKGEMPYYISNYNSETYKNKKRLYGLNKLYSCGLIDHLTKLTAKTIIIFGSLSRSDWHKDSDIDIFIYGDTEGLKISEYEFKLKREIQIFNCTNKDELKKYGSGLIRSIVKGDLIKGDIDFLEVDVLA